MIRNIVFDMGDVLLHYDSMRTCLRFAPSKEDAEAVNEALFKAPEWEGKLDGCFISEGEMLGIAQSRLQKEAHRELAAQIFANYHEDAMFPVEGMDAVVQSLHDRGFRIYLLSNVGSRFGAYKHKIPRIDLFDGILTSGEEHLVKPDPAIFRRLLERFGLRAEECLFIDDREKNIVSANAVGMEGYLFADGDVARLTGRLGQLEAPGPF